MGDSFGFDGWLLGIGLPEWVLQSRVSPSPEVEFFEKAGIEPDLTNLTRGWTKSGEFGEVVGQALSVMAPLAIDGLARVSGEVVLVKVKGNLAMVYRKKDDELSHEIWRRNDGE